MGGKKPDCLLRLVLPANYAVLKFYMGMKKKVILKKKKKKEFCSYICNLLQDSKIRGSQKKMHRSLCSPK